MAHIRKTRSRSLAVYGFLLRLYAPDFLARHRAEMLQNFEDHENASSSKAALWLHIGEDLMLSLISRNIPKSVWGRAAPMFVLLVAVFAVWRGFAYDVAPVSDPQALEFSSTRLTRIAAWQQTQIDAGAFSGAVAAIARNGKVAYLRAAGYRDRAKTIPLQADAIFWIASMTKPVTSVAAMILVEEGKLDLAAPVHHYLPELKDMMVGVETTDPASGQSRLTLEPQKRPMTVEDLLRHTSGLVYEGGDTAVHQLYRDSGLYDKGLARDGTLKDFVSRLARLPLAHQPGEVWEYGHSSDVLGRVIEVASGRPLDQFLDGRLFRPLGMIDTGFWVPPEKLARLVDAPVGAWIRPDRDVTKPTTLFSGGGGLVSTAADYLRFGQMLLNGGELDGVRILSPATVRRMTTNSLPSDIQFTGGDMGPRGSATFGLGFGIRSDAASSWVPGSVGSYTWSGLWGTYFWVDPAEQLIAIQLIQVATDYGRFTRPFRNLTYGAFLVPDRDAPISATAATDQVALDELVGKYDFGQSSSSRDRMSPVSNFSGIGADIELKSSSARIIRPLDNSPSAEAGLKPGDIITEIDGTPVKGLTLSQVIARLRGPVNSQTRLKITRAQVAPIEIAVTRAPIYVPGVELQVRIDAGNLVAEATGPWPILDFEKGKPVRLKAISEREFHVDDGYHTRITFVRDSSGKVASAVLNAGPWEQRGRLVTKRAS
ncbi:CubicO group peptidase (beta-lactamase class C family) [Bradyrhizobium sp. AZCC 2176]